MQSLHPKAAAIPYVILGVESELLARQSVEQRLVPRPDLLMSQPSLISPAGIGLYHRAQRP